MSYAVFDIDASGTIHAFSDTGLIFRYALGLRGSDLITGWVDLVNGTRITAPEIEAYLENIWWQVDVNGDGKTSLGDAWLPFLYVAGFRGPNLMAQYWAPGGCRHTPAQVEAYIAERLVP